MCCNIHRAIVHLSLIYYVGPCGLGMFVESPASRAVSLVQSLCSFFRLRIICCNICFLFFSSVLSPITPSPHLILPHLQREIGGAFFFLPPFWLAEGESGSRCHHALSFSPSLLDCRNPPPLISSRQKMPSGKGVVSKTRVISHYWKLSSMYLW